METIADLLKRELLNHTCLKPFRLTKWEMLTLTWKQERQLEKLLLNHNNYILIETRHLENFKV